MAHRAGRGAAIQLLKPYKMGAFDLFRQVVLAPMSRCRSYGNMPQPEAALYYSQRATTGGLLISEGTVISPDSLGYPEISGIWAQEQVEAWGPIVDAVHRKGALFFSQITHVGRVYTTGIQTDGRHTPISSTDKAITPNAEAGMVYPKPRGLHIDEMPHVINDFRRAARNAREAGFDGVEIHASHGFLLEQFMKDSANDRTDMYGGSLENRCRIVMEVVDAIVREVGAHRVGIRLSPFLDHMDCVDSDPEALAAYLVEQLNKHQGFLYCRMVEPHIAIVDGRRQIPHGLLSFKKAFNGTFIASGGYEKEEGNKVVSKGYAHRVPPRPAAGSRWLEPALLEVSPLQAVPSLPMPQRTRRLPSGERSDSERRSAMLLRFLGRICGDAVGSAAWRLHRDVSEEMRESYRALFQHRWFVQFRAERDFYAGVWSEAVGTAHSLRKNVEDKAERFRHGLRAQSKTIMDAYFTLHGINYILKFPDPEPAEQKEFAAEETLKEDAMRLRFEQYLMAEHSCKYKTKVWLFNEFKKCALEVEKRKVESGGAAFGTDLFWVETELEFRRRHGHEDD